MLSTSVAVGRIKLQPRPRRGRDRAVITARLIEHARSRFTNHDNYKRRSTLLEPNQPSFGRARRGTVTTGFCLLACAAVDDAQFRVAGELRTAASRPDASKSARGLLLGAALFLIDRHRGRLLDFT
jgi:hypothetical protein